MIVFDLDGTLRDSTCADHLIPKDPTKAANWVEWQKYVNEHGHPYSLALNILWDIFSTNVYAKVIVVTSSQFGTEKWLEKHHYINSDKDATITIHERKPDDNRTGFDYKKSFILDNLHEIDIWIDDDMKVCDYVESLGIAVVRVTDALR